MVNCGVLILPQIREFGLADVHLERWTAGRKDGDVCRCGEREIS